MKAHKVWGKGPVKISNIELDCCILDDGTPVLNKGKMMKAIGRSWKGNIISNRPSFIGAANLQPFVREEMEEKLRGIEYLDGETIRTGYHADILLDVCNTYLDARQAHVLMKNQLPIANTCESLVRSFAKAGVAALIYEQLGFDKPDVFKRLVENHLAEDVRKWSKEFPDELFFQMDRIYGNIRTTSRNRPLYYAKFIRKYIYDPIENGFLLSKLDDKNPKNDKKNRNLRHHSFLSEVRGLPELRAQIWQIVGLLKSSASKVDFERAYKALIKRDELPK